MKSALLCFSLLACIIGSLGADSDYVVKNPDVHGSPRELELFEAEQFNSRNGLVLRERMVFSDEGRLRRRNAFDQSGQLLVTTAYRYGAGGHVSEVIARDGAGELQWSHEYRHENDTVLQESHFGPDGSLEFTELYDYDDDGNLIERARYAGGGIPQWRTVYEYNGRENRTTWTMYYSDGRVLRQGVEERNREGLIVREVLRDEVDESFREVHFRYDDTGRVRERRTADANGVLQTVQRLRYDGHDNVIEEVVERFDGTVVRHSTIDYRYDRNGNWIERLTVEREQPEFGPVLETETRQVRTIRY